jgi:hypothetical protein
MIYSIRDQVFYKLYEKSQIIFLIFAKMAEKGNRMFL